MHDSDDDLFIIPINTATTSAKPCICPTVHMMLLLRICKNTHDKRHSVIWGSQTPKFQCDGSCMLGQAEEGRRFAKGSVISPQSCAHAAAGRGPVQLLASFLTISGWLWFMPGSSGSPRAVPSSDIPYLLAISHDFHPSLSLGREIRINLLVLGIFQDPSYTGGCKPYGRQNICVTYELINKIAIGSGTEHVCCPWQLRRCIPNPWSLQNKTKQITTEVLIPNCEMTTKRKAFVFHLPFFLELNST